MPYALPILSLTAAAVVLALHLRHRAAVAAVLREASDEIYQLRRRVTEVEVALRRSAARAFHHHGHRDEAVEITPPVVRTDRRNPFGYGR